MAQRKFLIDGGFEVNDDSVINANLEMAGNILPAVDSDGTTGYDLGSPTLKWRDLYLSSGSLYIDGQKVVESDAGTIVVQADPDQSLTTKTSGSGVLTFQSPNPIAIAGTLQIGATHRITDAAGNAVTFGDKIDMDNNQITNVALPTADGHAATKKYVDDMFDDVINGAPAALDTLNELANALGDDANFASTVTTSLATKATTAYVDAQIAAVNASSAAADAVASDLDTVETLLGTGSLDTTANNVVNAINELKGRADTNAATAATNASDIASNATAITNAISTAAADATTKANAAESNATTAAATDATTKANAAQAAAISAASTDATTKANAALVDAKAYADQAEADAIATASADATTKADAAEADAIATAASDATTKANAAQAAAQNYAQTKADEAQADAEATAEAYTDARESVITTAYQSYADSAVSTAISNLVDGAPGALNTLNELAAAVNDDQNFASTVTTSLATKFSTITHVHGSPVVVTATQSTNNDTAAVSISLGQTNLDSYQVFLNRQILRPTEYTYSSNGNVSFVTGLLSTDDELEITGFRAS